MQAKLIKRLSAQGAAFPALRYLGATLLMLATVVPFLAVSQTLAVPNAGIVFVLVSLMAALWLGTGPAVLAGVLSVGASAYVYYAIDSRPAVTIARLIILAATLAAAILIGRLARRERARSLAIAAEARRRAGEEEATRAQLEAVFQAFADGVVIFDMAGNVVLANEAEARIAGYVSAEAMKRDLAHFAEVFELQQLDGRLLPVAEWPAARVLRGESVHDFELHTRRRDTGQEWYFSFSAEPVRDAAGRQILAVVITRDVTHRRQAEDERDRLLVENEELVEMAQRRAAEFATVIESIADAIFVCNDTGRITLVNRAGLALIGKERGEPLGTLADYMEALQISRPDGTRIPLAELSISRALHGGVVASAREEIALHPKTGQHLDLLISAAPLRDETGRIVGAVSVLTDITAQRQLGETARRRAAELQAVLDNMVDAVFVADALGRIRVVNEAGAAILGLSAAEASGRPLSELPSLMRLRAPDGRALAPSDLALARALLGHTSMHEEMLVYDRGHKQDRLVRSSASPIRDENGALAGAVAVDRDVTALAELDRQKEVFISAAAHELKTPVAIMKGYAQLLLRSEEGSSPRQRKMLDAIFRGARRIEGIVADLLHISKLQAAGLDLTLEPFDLVALVGDAAERMALSAPKHSLIMAPAAPVMVRADRGRLEQVLSNLLDNAVKYSPGGGPIELSVTAHDDRAIVAVRDHGVGIPNTKQAGIFQRFYRAHDRTPYDYSGLGVGLYISNEIITRHRGRMWFESEEGAGSCFYFSLPLG